jgi:hypothetical protein
MCLCIKQLCQLLKSVEFVSDMVLYIMQRGLWCHVMVLKIHTTTEDKINYVKDICKELGHLFNKFPKYI